MVARNWLNLDVKARVQSANVFEDTAKMLRRRAFQKRRRRAPPCRWRERSV